jgi:hypothetical protein
VSKFKIGDYVIRVSNPTSGTWDEEVILGIPFKVFDVYTEYGMYSIDLQTREHISVAWNPSYFIAAECLTELDKLIYDIPNNIE